MKKNVIILLILAKVTCGKSQNYPWERKYFQDSSQILNTLLNRPIEISRISTFHKDKNVSNSIKKRLLFLIDYKWTVDEYEKYLNTFRLNNKESFISYAKELSKNIYQLQ